MNITGGSTDVTTYVALTLLADGTDATGLTITDLDLQYCRSGASPAAKVDATALAAVNSAHGDNQAIEVDATDQPGLYRVDWPDAAFAAGVKEVVLSVKHTSCKTAHLRVTIDAPVNVTSLNADQQSLTDLKDFADAGYDPSTNKVTGVVLVDTLTTYTGNTPQTGDAYAIVNSGTHGNAALKSLIDAVDNFVDTEITALQGDVTSILGDTNELQTDWANGGRLDLLLDAAKENTDYPDGYVYLDSANGGAGTTVGTNGTARNPANSFDNAATIAVDRGTAGIRLVPGYVGETIPASGSPSTYTAYLVDLAGSTLTIESGSWPLLQQFRIVSTGMKGKIIGDGGAAEFDQCYIENVSMNGVIIENTYADFYYVVFTGDITINDWDGSTPVKLFGCYSGLSDTPIVIDFTTSGASAVLQYWSGDIEIQNLGAGQVVEINGYGNCTINANCTGGTIKHTSHVEITDNASGAVTTELISEAGPATEVLGGINTAAGTIKTLDALDTAQDTQHGTTQTAVAAISTTVGAAGAGLTAIPKTGYKLASDGLDSVSTTAPAGVASNFREMVVQTWRRFFKRTTLTSTELKTYADNGTSVLTTQAVSDDLTTQDQGAAT